MGVRVLLGILAVLVLSASLALGTGAAWLWSTFGADGGAVRSLGRIDASAPLMVIDVEDVQTRIPFGIPGRVELVVDAGTTPVTVLAGATPDVDRLVFGTTYAVARLVGGQWSTVGVAGVRATPDLGSVTWGIGASGAPAVLELSTPAPTSLVIGRTGAELGSVTLALRYAVADAGTIALLGGAVAAFLLIVGIVLIWAAVIGLRARGRHE